MTDRFYPTELTCFCLVESQGQLLVMQKIDSEFAPSMTFPGGHVEPDEALTAAATRELAEECGLTVATWRLASVVNFKREDGRKELIFVFAGTLPAPNQTHHRAGTKDEGQTRWVPIAEIGSMVLNPVVQAVYDAYRSGQVKELYFN
ncbi:NUDIX domain-containing protein [Lacticaseibacillus suibinensis]|uniref:NUDIX domain-containing protein n=1 Tax=Lacticaseibacillus suibinensis TaxID=2486011 RepID=UPI000F7B6515|nr:NUDIX domain-containing protein [Lacticaseibacillus suibinensis]